MNRRVTFSMVVLCLSYLFSCYYLKILFPQDFALVVSNDRILAVGDAIDASPSLTYACAGITSLLTYSLYCCACSGRLRLRVYEYAVIIATIALIRWVSVEDPNLATGIQLASFMFLPYMTRGRLKNCAIVYTIHCLSQSLSLSIRDLPLYFTRVNSAVALVAGSECLVWLVLMVFLLYRKENK